MKKLITIMIAAIFMWQMAGAVNYYVSTTGNDNSTTPTNIATPFKTITKAGCVATAGDVVFIADGTYSNSSISNSGNASTYIVF